MEEICTLKNKMFNREHIEHVAVRNNSSCEKKTMLPLDGTQVSF